MADRWIVTRYDYVRHKTLALAEEEQKRLSEKHPQYKFEIIRIKTWREPSDTAKCIADLRAENSALRQQIMGEAAE